MRTLHLFAGAGGGLYADLILGHTPVCAVELDPYACAVLRARAADGWWPDLHVHEGDVRVWDPSPWAGRVDCVAAGFPCQDISVAGGGAGLAGERSGLWSEVRRAVADLRPRFAFLENSPAIVGRGLDVVLADLASLGYDARWLVLGADDVGAPHIRKRWWCLAWRADADGGRREGERQPEHGGEQGAPGREPDRLGSRGCGDGAPLDDALRGRHGSANEALCAGRDASVDAGWWAAEPDVGRVADAVAARRHRLHGLGNGQVPLAAAAAWRLLGGPVAP
jgi:DNA (cytosine-5)-methyltransferase 1